MLPPLEITSNLELGTSAHSHPSVEVSRMTLVLSGPRINIQTVDGRTTLIQQAGPGLFLVTKDDKSVLMKLKEPSPTPLVIQPDNYTPEPCTDPIIQRSQDTPDSKDSKKSTKKKEVVAPSAGALADNIDEDENGEWNEGFVEVKVGPVYNLYSTLAGGIDEDKNVESNTEFVEVNEEPADIEEESDNMDQNAGSPYLIL